MGLHQLLLLLVFSSSIINGTPSKTSSFLLPHHQWDCIFFFPFKCATQLHNLVQLLQFVMADSRNALKKLVSSSMNSTLGLLLLLLLLLLFLYQWIPSTCSFFQISFQDQISCGAIQWCTILQLAALKTFYIMGPNKKSSILSTISCGAIQWCAFATAALKFFYKMGSNHIIAILSTISCGAIQWCAFATAALKFFYKMGPDKIIENVEYSLCNSVVHIWNCRIEKFPHNGY